MTTNNALLFQLINGSNKAKYKLKPSDVTASDPQIDITSERNSKILLTARPKSGLKGEVWVRYNRESIGNVHLPTQLLSEITFTIGSILAAINQKLLVPITAADLEPFDLPVLNVGDILTINLMTKANSFAWIGGTQISILFGLPPNIDDVSEIFNVRFPSIFT
jgi:hypothetical protein